ncbi:MAG: arsenite methyltransferase [Mycobacterium sp.]|jgi:arsenite methyltransferase|nr:arsenite methyltransferase [Mycobacterium sp.]
MTDVDTQLPPALRRALELFSDPPANPDVRNGYLDLLGDQPAGGVPKNTGAIQAAWASPLGSLFYDSAQALSRRLMVSFRHPIEWLAIPQGGVALDVGCGPGSVTASLARAVRAQAGPQTGFMLADAQQLPLRDETVDAVVSIAVLQLIPDPKAALTEMGRVLRPGGRLAVMVPTAGPAARLWRNLPIAGAHAFGEDELGDILEDHGFTRVRITNFGSIQWVRGKR